MMLIFHPITNSAIPSTANTHVRLNFNLISSEAAVYECVKEKLSIVDDSTKNVVGK